MYKWMERKLLKKIITWIISILYLILAIVVVTLLAIHKLNTSAAIVLLVFTAIGFAFFNIIFLFSETRIYKKIDHELQSNKFMYIFVFLPIFIFPLLTGILVSFPSPINLDQNNEWISFFGSFFGGALTLAGVIITIKYSQNQFDENQRKGIKPYITVTHSTCEFYNDSSIIGLAYCANEENNRLLYFNEIEINGNYENIGLGPAINIAIYNISIGERKIKNPTNQSASLKINSISIYKILLYNISLSKNQLSNRFLDYYNTFFFTKNTLSKPPELNIEFDFVYEDMLGNKYKQHVQYYGQITSSTPPIELNILFKSIGKVQDVTESDLF